MHASAAPCRRWRLRCLLASCANQIEIAPHLRPLPHDTMMLLGKKGMDAQAPIFIRIFKEESELEIWKQRDDGRFYHFKTYPICNWSGDLGPKVRYGDRQAPEGFYTVTREQMNPDSKYHLALNLGYPNAYDRSQKRTGDFLMIHGNCKSAGCYAMTDALIEEIYAIARESFIGGNDSFQVHAFPFRMTNENMARFSQPRGLPVLADHEGGLRLLRADAEAADRRRLQPALRGERRPQSRRPLAARSGRPPARRSSSPSPIRSSRGPASSSPSSASSCPARRCAAWRASRTGRRGPGCCRPARRARRAPARVPNMSFAAQ